MNPTLSSMIAWCPCGTGNLTAHAAFARVGNRDGTGYDMALPWTWSFLGVALSAMTGSVGLFFSWCWWPLMGDCCIPGWMWWCTYFLLWTWVVDRCTSKDLERGWLLLWYGVDGVVAKSGVSYCYKGSSCCRLEWHWLCWWRTHQWSWWLWECQCQHRCRGKSVSLSRRVHEHQNMTHCEEPCLQLRRLCH